MNIEMKYLVWVSLLTAVLWIPYILNTIMVRGLVNAVGYPQNPAPLAPWASRLKAAHYNAVENLVVFAALILAANMMKVSNDLTVLAASLYFWARVVHPVAYTFAVPWLRTLAFALGFVAQMMLGWAILMQ